MGGKAVHVVHLISGDLWAGAEVATWHLLTRLARCKRVSSRAIILNQGELAARLRASGVPTEIIDERVRGSFRLLGEVRTGIGASRTDILHSHRYKEHAIAAIIAARLGIPHVRTAHGLPPPLRFDGELRGVGALVDSFVAGVLGANWIAVSRDLAQHVGGLRGRTFVVPNGIPTEPPPASPALRGEMTGEIDDAWVLGYVGRFEEVKRPDRFVQVIAALPATIAGRQIRGVMAGDGSLSPTVQEVVRLHGLEHRVRLLGHRNDTEALVEVCDVLVVPSDHEGHPMVVLEAMRAGTPVVAAAVGGLPAMLGGGCALAPPGDALAIAAVVRALLESEPLRRAESERLRRLFLEQFTIDVCAARTRDVYLTLCQARA